MYIKTITLAIDIVKLISMGGNSSDIAEMLDKELNNLECALDGVISQWKICESEKIKYKAALEVIAEYKSYTYDADYLVLLARKALKNKEKL